MSKTPLFRHTKTRNNRTQAALQSSYLQYKQQKDSNEDTIPSYHQTYNIELPQCSINILEPIIAALSPEDSTINLNTRKLHTIGLWYEDTTTILRCCFIQPEISSATCSFGLSYYNNANTILKSVCDKLPDAPPSRLIKHKVSCQLSGRMTPYIISDMKCTVNWGFANISKSYFLFLITTVKGIRILYFTKNSITILKEYFPSYSVCVYDVKSSSFKVTVEPDKSNKMNEPNKNTCLCIYNDGSFRFQGHPLIMPKISRSFREAIISISKSIVWESFINSLNENPCTETQVPMTRWKNPRLIHTEEQVT
jgi:hypothetical protein